MNPYPGVFGSLHTSIWATGLLGSVGLAFQNVPCGPYLFRAVSIWARYAAMKSASVLKELRAVAGLTFNRTSMLLLAQNVIIESDMTPPILAYDSPNHRIWVGRYVISSHEYRPIFSRSLVPPEVGAGDRPAHPVATKAAAPSAVRPVHVRNSRRPKDMVSGTYHPT